MVRNAFRDPPTGAVAPFSPLPASLTHGVIRRVNLPPGKKLVALTFDLCEEPYEIAGYQGGIVDYLRANNVHATFFAGGKWMLTHRTRTQQIMSDSRFQIANHTWEHRNLRLLKGDKLVEEIKSAQIAYEKVREDLAAKQCVGPDRHGIAREQAPRRLSMIRFPFGACNDEVLDATNKLGLIPIQWDVSSGDAPPGQSPKEMLKDVLTVRPGSIVLFHANGRGLHTTETLPSIVHALKARGYEFVTVEELLAAGKPVMTPTCYDKKPGDADRYDRLAARLEQAYARARAQVLSPHQGAEAAAPAIELPPEPSGAEAARAGKSSLSPLRTVPLPPSRPPVQQRAKP